MNKDTQSWSNSNLTEMEELLQKVQQLETENADISHAYGVTRDVVKGLCEELANLKAENAALRNELASLKHQTQWECSCGGTDCEGMKENAALRSLLRESLDCIDQYDYEEAFDMVQRIKAALGGQP